MSYTSRFVLGLGVASLACIASAQEAPKKKQLTARQLFYAAVQPPTAAPKPKTESKPKSALRKGTPKPPETGPNGGQTTVPPTLPDSGQPVHPPGDAPLGLRYTVLKFSGDTANEVPTDTVFRAGDRAQLRVEANTPGYLYVISQGTSGAWKPIFPSPEVEMGDNHVDSLHPYTLPSEDHRIVFDENAGTERLFIILSRQPEPDLEKMIYSLQRRPASKPKQLANGRDPRIDDATVGRMREAYARDLIIEWVTPATPGEKKETAVYVVNPTGSSSSRVVADLTLAHR